MSPSHDGGHFGEERRAARRVGRQDTRDAAPGLLAGAAALIGLSAGGDRRLRRRDRTAAASWSRRYAPSPPAWPAGRKLTITVIADLHAGGPDMSAAARAADVDTANATEFRPRRHARRLYRALSVHDRAHPRRRSGRPNWRACRRRSAFGRSSAITTGGTISPACAMRSPKCAFRVLENQAVLLGPEGERVWVAGIGDQIAYRIGHGRFRGVDDLPGTLAQVTTDDPVILLVHEPDIFPRVPSRVALTLCRPHPWRTDPRAVDLAGVRAVAIRQALCLWSRCRGRERHLIVSGGLGTSIIPARFGVPPEIVHVTLTA